MKKLTYKLIMSVLALFIFSCEKPALSIPATEIVVVDIDNSNTYLFADISSTSAAEKGWIKIKNGKGNYTFFIENETITLQSTKEIIQITVMSDTFGSDKKQLPVKGNTCSVSGYCKAIFKIKY